MKTLFWCLLLASAGWGQGTVIQGALKNVGEEKLKADRTQEQDCWITHHHEATMSDVEHVTIRCTPAEPVDVPAIKDKPKLIIASEKGDPYFEKGFSHPSVVVEGCKLGRTADKFLVWTCPIWTCQDRSRILLTDESGGKHCVKFQ